MGGTAKWGFVHSKLTLLSGAPVILTPDKNIAPEKLKTLEQFFLDIGFGEVVSSSPAEHDRIIAFSSQLAHVVSSAYVKGSAVRLRKGFSAGSYRDMTRVAKLNEKMWTELFLENADFLGDELTELIFRLAEYRQALLNKNAAELERLLREGREIKEKC
jgi:prephenate dehydrogenase